jgi:hypothetical protein
MISENIRRKILSKSYASRNASLENLAYKIFFSLFKQGLIEM